MRASMLEKEIDTYLSETDAMHGAQGGDALQGVTIHASLTTVIQGTVGQGGAIPGLASAEDIAVLGGDVDLQFDFTITDNLSLFINLTANNPAGSLENNFGVTRISTLGTAASADGIGVNGTTPTRPGSAVVEEAGVRYSMNVGNTQLHNEIGQIDPRERFLQNAFADDENTQFINNEFDDPSAVPWLTNAGGLNSYGWMMWVSFGDNKQFTISWGWFSPPGQWFRTGQLYVQFHWKGEIAGREMNLRVMGFWQNLFKLGTETDDAGGGVSWDWWANDKIGVFLRIAVNGSDINPVEFDASVGAIFAGLIGSRPDDVLGVAVGFITINETVTGIVPEDTELTVEIYWKFMLEDGKLQITPHAQYIADPGGGEASAGGSFADSSLFILGVRVHVPF